MNRPLTGTPNYYRILGITPLADPSEIKHAYRALAKRYHPDAVPPDKQDWAREQMIRINQAYRVLQDPQQRALYHQRRGYPWPIPGSTAANLPPDAPSDSPGTAIWRRRRIRERSRRQKNILWRWFSWLCAVALLSGLILTTLYVHTRTGYAISALINGGLFVLLMVGATQANL